MKNASRARFGGVTALTVAFLIAVSVGRAQVRKTDSGLEVFGAKDSSPGMTAVPVQSGGPALESTIAPDSYFVGPSDVFAVNVWVNPPIALRLTVTPEGTLIIPSVGEIRVSDLTLADARRKVYAEMRKRYTFGEATVTLITPRDVIVTVQGRVMNQGSYVMPAYRRVDKAVEEAIKPRAGQLPEEVERIRPFMSTRRIIVRHKDGTQARVDLKQFLATKEDRWNPYLREGDLIIVPALDNTRNVIGVYGEVNSAGRFEFVEGDSVKTALRMANGLTPLAQGDSVEFTRQNPDGEIAARRIVDGAAILRGATPDFALEPGDRLVVYGRVDQRADYAVKVVGQVRNPGTYPITRNSTRLSEAIRFAGGFADDASLSSAELVHESVPIGEIENERLVSLRGGVPPEDSAYFFIETELRMKKEAVTADFVRLFVQGDTTQDVLLRDGDMIVVPKRRQTVYVFGQVVNPGHIPFSANEEVGYYLKRAGGLTDRARSDGTTIVKAKTHQWLSPDDTSIEEGDYVWVPMAPERPFGYYLGVASQSAAVIGAALTVVLLVLQIKN